jgi:hypothetical protein
MTTLVVGASGATGRKLVDQLLSSNQTVKVIVRTAEELPKAWKENEQLSIIQASVLDIGLEEMAKHVKDCHAVVSCLGHNMSWKGIYGEPRNLVTAAVNLLCNAIKESTLDRPTKLVLMNTSGNSNRDLDEPISKGQRCLMALLRLLLPPHVDNETAADYLRIEVGQNNNLIEWVAVRPDGLINEDEVTEYTVYPSPIRSAIFEAGKISRMNVGHFMTELITRKEVWERWKGQMPVIYQTVQTVDL